MSWLTPNACRRLGKVGIAPTERVSGEVGRSFPVSNVLNNSHYLLSGGGR